MTGLKDTGVLSSKSFSSDDSRKDADGAFLGFMVEPGDKKPPHTVQTPEQTRNEKRNEEEKVLPRFWETPDVSLREG